MKQAVIVVLAVLAVVGGVIFGISRVADVSPLDKETPEEERAKASEWETEAAAAFGGADLTEKVVDMVEGARQWLRGERPTDQFSAELAARETQFIEVRARLAKLRDFPYDDRVLDLYGDAATLYAASVTSYQAMVAAADADMRTQLDFSARRLRILGDRVFDRGRELVKPKLHEKPRPDVDIRLPDEVPDWVQEGIAPGPPIEDPPPPPSSTEPRLRQPNRPQMDEEQWENLLSATKPPPIPRQIAVNDSAALRFSAQKLIQTAEGFRGLADPEGDRERGTRFRLSLVVHAEAARVGQLAIQGGNDRLRHAAAEVYHVGMRLRELE